MIYLFLIALIYLIGLIFYGAYAYDKVENFYIPYEKTNLDRKIENIKNNVVISRAKFK
jgi:hypothetical protein